MLNNGPSCNTCKKSVEGDIFIPPNKLEAFDDTKDMGTVDWVLITLKTTGLDSIPSLILPLLTKQTRVLAIMNGLCDEDIVKYLEDSSSEVLTKCAATYGGMALLCSNRIAPGHIDHSYAGKLTASIAASSQTDDIDIETHKHAMISLWDPTIGFEFVYDDNLTRARWTKNVWNLPFNGISVAMGGITVDKIVNDPGLRKLADIIMDETISVANTDLESRGYDSHTFLGQAEVSTTYCIVLMMMCLTLFFVPQRIIIYMYIFMYVRTGINPMVSFIYDYI